MRAGVIAANERITTLEQALVRICNELGAIRGDAEDHPTRICRGYLDQIENLQRLARDVAAKATR